MHYVSQSTDRTKAIVNFIQEKYPNINKVNPFLDSTSIDEIERDLQEAGFFKVRKSVGSGSVINYVLMAQGKHRLKRRATP